MSSDTTEYPPLLPEGFHELTIGGLRDLCVTSERFLNSSRRSKIMANLERAIQTLVINHIQGELWINGSFLTEKPEPADVDVSLRIDAEFFDRANSWQLLALKRFTEIADIELIDGYLHLEWPIGHEHHRIGVENFNYWKNQWGVSRTGVAKGIAMLKLG